MGVTLTKWEGPIFTGDKNIVGNLILDNGADRSVYVDAAAAATAGDDLSIYAGSGTGTGNRDGGDLYLHGGDAANSGTDGDVILGLVNGGAARGNVGIGVLPTMSLFPNRYLVLGGATNPGFVLKPTSSAQEATFASNGSGFYFDVAGSATAANNFMAFRTTNTDSDFTMVERLRIASAGNVSIGTAAAPGSLELDGDLRFDSSPGTEQVTNGTPTSATGWTLGADWAYGSSLFTKAVGVGTSTVSQATTVGVVNDIVRIVYKIEAGMTGTSVTMSFGGVTGTARTAAGTYTEYITCTSTAALTFTPTADFVGSISTFSVKKVGVVAADRVTAWVGDRLSAGVAQAGEGSLFFRSEDGTLTSIGGPVNVDAPNGTLRLGTTGAARLTINSTGIGYGATSPTTAIDFGTTVTNVGQIINLRTTGNTRMGIGMGAADGSMRLYSASNEGGIRLGVIELSDGTTFTQRMRVDDSGEVLINADVAYADNGELLEVNKSADDGGIGLFCWSTTDAERPLIEFHKSSSATIGTKALVALDESLGAFVWRGADGVTNWQSAASIEAFVDATPGAGDMGGRLVLSTSADGGATPLEAVRVDSTQMARFLAGNVKIANATDGGTGGLHIRSKRAISAAMSGATVNIAIQIPSGAMILGAQFNVDTLIEGATTWSAAFNTGSTTSLGSGYALAQNTKVNQLIVPELATAATDITLTAAGSNFTAGVIEAIVYYCDVSSMANA